MGWGVSTFVQGRRKRSLFDTLASFRPLSQEVRCRLIQRFAWRPVDHISVRHQDAL